MTHLMFAKQTGKSYLVSNKRNVPLGKISWFPEWKCWVWEQFDCIIMSLDCLREVDHFMSLIENNKICLHCGGDIAIRNPTGNCDHLHYPENCIICQRIESAEAGFGKVCKGCNNQPFCEDRCDALVDEMMQESEHQ